MQRNSILIVAAIFCVVAIAAGYVVTNMSASGAAPISAQEGAPTSAGAPTETLEEAPSAMATAELAPTKPSIAAAPEATVPPEAATAAPTAAPEAATAAPEPPTAVPASPTFIEYTVQKGDELQAIAKQYNVTVKDIIANNTIANPDSLVIGQVLRIPQQ